MSSSSSSASYHKPYLLLWVTLSSSLFQSLVLQLEAASSQHVDGYSEELAHHSSGAHHHQPYRTSFHFQPPKNWMNDPNGPMIHKGIYHLFYQYNPYGAVWGNITWAHSTSTDLINWIPQELAIYPSQPGDINGCWSGSTTILPGDEPAILYTGIIDSHNSQVQNLAVPKNLSDPYLREWIKSPKNPLMTPTIENKINASSFRDPTTAWIGHDGKWRVIIGSKINRRGMAILYTSKDFVNWIESGHPLYSDDNTGMWECPDFYPVAVGEKIGLNTSVVGPKYKHVLKVSLDDTKHDQYTIGEYDPGKDSFVPDKRPPFDSVRGLRYDYGKFYASKTFFDSSKNRRILWGWINESSSTADDIKKGWSGIQGIPRSLWLEKSGKQLVQWPVPEIKKLRYNHVHLADKVLEKGSLVEISGITAAQADVEIAFKLKGSEMEEEMEPSWNNPQLLCGQMSASSAEGGIIGPFGLLVLASKGLQEYTAVFFRVFKSKDKHVVLMCSDQSRSSLNNDNDKTTYGAFLDVDPIHEELTLRTLIDHSVVESFGGEGRSCITARVYPRLAIDDNAHLYAFNHGAQGITISRLNAWSMKKAHIS